MVILRASRTARSCTMCIVITTSRPASRRRQSRTAPGSSAVATRYRSGFEKPESETDTKKNRIRPERCRPIRAPSRARRSASVRVGSFVAGSSATAVTSPKAARFHMICRRADVGERTRARHGVIAFRLDLYLPIFYTCSCVRCCLSSVLLRVSFARTPRTGLSGYAGGNGRSDRRHDRASITRVRP